MVIKWYFYSILFPRIYFEVPYTPNIYTCIPFAILLNIHVFCFIALTTHQSLGNPIISRLWYSFQTIAVTKRMDPTKIRKNTWNQLLFRFKTWTWLIFDKNMWNYHHKLSSVFLPPQFIFHLKFGFSFKFTQRRLLHQH